jgi:pyruvate formate lyase activating enzyme
MINNKFVGMEKLSLVDYEGKLACTLFTNGCNFKCPFCHNSSLVIKDNYNYIEDEEILSYLQKRTKQLDAVVITGGEPTLMSNLIDQIKKIKQLGFLIKLDTNGSNPDTIKYLVENKLIDYIAMDIKNSFEKYSLTTGINNINIDNIKNSINYIMNCGIDYEFRTTLVKDHHSEQDITNISNLIKNCKKYYLQKFNDNENCISAGLNSIDKKTAEHYKNILTKNIPNTYLRGY